MISSFHSQENSQKFENIFQRTQTWDVAKMKVKKLFFDHKDEALFL